MMTPRQAFALTNHCRLGIETMRREFAYKIPALGASCVLTVNSGYE